MTNRVVITTPAGVRFTVEVDGVPDVAYEGDPPSENSGDRIQGPNRPGTDKPWDQGQNAQGEFPPFPSQASSVPQCKVHNSAMKPGRSGGWYCPRKVGDGWCTERVNA